MLKQAAGMMAGYSAYRVGQAVWDQRFSTMLIAGVVTVVLARYSRT